ncbi:MAG: chromosomal replication initiator protein DnaA [Candidatus Fonsibacter sp.]|nr:chromosomal replication initiator protein DnaA [Candidatus Fonsibacter sp.]
MVNQISLKDNLSNDKARWDLLQQSLSGFYGKDVYTSWLQNINFTKINYNTLVLNVKTRFIRDWIVAHYADKILDLYKKQDANITRIEFQILERAEAKSNKSNVVDFEKKDLIQDSGSYGLSKINEILVFDNFVVGKSNELAFTAANRIIDNLNKYNPLYIYGGVGLGKTHLLNAIGNKLLKKIDKVIYVSAERFMYQFVRSIKNNDVVKFKDIFRSAKVLIIDDIQFVSGKDVTQEEFFHTFNALIESGSQIVISCDRPPNELDRIQDRIKSRLSGGLVVDIQSPDFEQRVKILKQRCLKEFHASERNIAIDDEVINFIANELKLSVREMIGAFNRIAAYLNINNRKISVAEAKSILRDSLNKIETNITIEDIQKTVVSYYNISMHDFMSSRRSRSVARPRQIAMYLSKKMTTKSLPDIGRRFSGRDHTTVIHAIKKVEMLMIQDKNFENEVKDLNQKLTKTA